MIHPHWSPKPSGTAMSSRLFWRSKGWVRILPGGHDVPEVGGMAETALLLDLMIQEENVDDPILQFFVACMYTNLSWKLAQRLQVCGSDLQSSSERVRSNRGSGIRPGNNVLVPFSSLFKVWKLRSRCFMWWPHHSGICLAPHFWRFGGNAFIFQALEVWETAIVWFLVRISGEWLF